MKKHVSTKLAKERDENAGSITVLLVEDHELLRFGIKTALKKPPDITVVGEAVNGMKGIEMARDLQPAVVLMDIGLPELNGIDATRTIKSEYPGIRVVMLTSFDDSQRTCAALAAGADAYCVKTIPMDKLIAVIRRVHAGYSWLDPTVASHIVRIYAVESKQEEPPESESLETVVDEEDEALTGLTRQEIQVLRLLMIGKEEDEIALQLAVNASTIRGYIRKILSKLSKDERTQSYLASLLPGLA